MVSSTSRLTELPWSLVSCNLAAELPQSNQAKATQERWEWGDGETNEAKVAITSPHSAAL